jgi:hypothetical protein
VDTFSFVLSGLTENDFNYTNTGSASAHLAAHVQGIPVPGGGTTSGAIKETVPDGGMTAMLLGGALIGLEALRRRFRP